jgi:hypothetical protein
MYLSNAAIDILHQLQHLIGQVSQADFCKPSQNLSESTLGQHVRHTMEFFICFQTGFHNGVINYDKRAHDKLMESDKNVALSVLGDIIQFILQIKEDRTLKLEIGASNDPVTTISTNCSRELLYNIEHAIHHMALIRIGVQEVAPYVNLGKHFGVAASTIEYTKAVLQSHD